ncbi:hypothetical protein JCM11641_001952 [Rhodosporidiobolus odoratus]
MNHHPPPPIQPALQPAVSSGVSSFASLSLNNVLEDLSARFIVNLPAEELESMDRVCFQIEQAHWYYEDFIRPTATNPALLPSYGLKAFSLLMFKSCPLLHDLLPSHGQIWTSFMAYKERVPVCGAVMINEYWDKVLLVKGWNKGASWSFPRGKINKQEPEAMCAVREVLEETGFDLTPHFPPHQLHPNYAGEEEGIERIPYYVELVIREQKIRLYFIPTIPEGTRFETRTRKEISKIDWFALSSLPTWNQNQRVGRNPGSMRSKGELANGRQAKYYMVTPFISHLKLWIDRNKPKNLQPRPYPSSAAVPLSPEWDSPRPYNPTPHQAALGHHALVPWDDATYHLPSETEHEPSEVATSTEEEDEGESEDELEAVQVAQKWESTKEGSEALNALFFGSPPAQPALALPHQPSLLPIIPTASSTSSLPASQHPTPPARPSPLALQHCASSSSLDVASTPPQVAYERQQSFLQPRAQQSKSQQGQQARLLELLTGQGLSTPPPPVSVPAFAAGAGPHAAGWGSLLGLLNGMHLASSSSSVDAHAQQQHHASILFGGAPATSSSHAHSFATDPNANPNSVFTASPPPEAHGPVLPHEDRAEEEKKEKHDALLRALFSVAAKCPPGPPPPLASTVEVEEGYGRAYSGATPRSDEIEALFHSAGSSGSAGAAGGGGARRERRKSTLSVEGFEVDAQGWLVASGVAVGGGNGGEDACHEFPDEVQSLQHHVQQEQQQPEQGIWTSLSGSDEASDGSRRRRNEGPTGSGGGGGGAGGGKGSLLAILNQPRGGAPQADVQTGAAHPSPSGYSHQSAKEARARDPLQVLREYRNKQAAPSDSSSYPHPLPLPQPTSSLSPPQPQPKLQPQPQEIYSAPPPLPLPQQQYYSPPQPAMAIPPQAHPVYHQQPPFPVSLPPAPPGYLPHAYPGSVQPSQLYPPLVQPGYPHPDQQPSYGYPHVLQPQQIPSTFPPPSQLASQSQLPPHPGYPSYPTAGQPALPPLYPPPQQHQALSHIPFSQPQPQPQLQQLPLPPAHSQGPFSLPLQHAIPQPHSHLANGPLPLAPAQPQPVPQQPSHPFPRMPQTQPHFLQGQQPIPAPVAAAVTAPRPNAGALLGLLNAKG